ncbi:MAG: YraN family protein [Cytophagaceae bacterium]
MAEHNLSGQLAEEKAAVFLKEKGYEILERNYRYRRSEIDIIAKRENIIVFVEVKYRSRNNFGDPESSVDEKKETQVLNAAENYVFDKDWHGEIRFDIISILRNQAIEHFEDAFG